MRHRVLVPQKLERVDGHRCTSISSSTSSLGQGAGESLAGTMQPHRQRCAAHAERLRGLVDSQALPGDEKHQLPVTLAQAGEGALHTVIDPGVDHLGLGAGPVVGEAFVQCGGAAVRTAPIGEHLPGDPEQPGERLIGYLGQPAPDDEEDLGDHVIGRAGRRAPQRVGMNAIRVRAVQPLELRLGFHHSGTVHHRPNHYTPADPPDRQGGEAI